jgi:hypothetical protein
MNIQDKCLRLYESGGQWAVIDYCRSIRWGNWMKCASCECFVPVRPKDGSCLVCGKIATLWGTGVNYSNGKEI